MRGLIFDYDGLMVDSESVRVAALVDLMGSRGVQIEVAEIGRFVGSSRPDVERRWTAWLGERLGSVDAVAAFEDEFRHHATEHLRAIELNDGVMELIDGARELEWRIGVGSGQGRKTLVPALKRLGVFERLDAVVSGTDVATGKPAPDIFLEVARKLEVPPERCIVLEDSEPGCKAALAAGMEVIACPCDVTASSDFPSGVQMVTSLREIDLAKL